VESPLVLQFSIALFTGMVAATFFPPIRKTIPRVVEVGLWIALFTACSLGVLSVTDPNARDLSAATVWGITQVVNNVASLLLGGIAAWISANRFAIATWLVIIAGVDVFALMLLGSIRSATPWKPRVRLGEWMELPVSTPAPALARQPALADPLAGANRRLAGASAVLATAMLARSLTFSIWAVDRVRTRRLRGVAQEGASGSRARLDSLQNGLAHLLFAVRSWYVAAGRPAVDGVVERAGGAVRTAHAAQHGLRTGAFRPGQVIDIRALVNAPSIGWYGPLGAAAPADSTRGDDDDGIQTPRPDTLAS
jgi:hypothetical protein